MEKIQNFETYTKLMRNGNYDKLFFVDKLFGDWKTFVDYGCADGFQTLTIAEVFPTKTIIGYDSDSKMIELANKNLKENHPNVKNVIFTDDYRFVVVNKPDIIFISSVIHEIYSYLSSENIDKFWGEIFDNNIKYIVIRDMIYDEQVDRISDANMVRKVLRYCNEKGISNKLNEFEKTQGSISNYKNLIHFLLKYSYVDSENWQRELHENYLKLTIQKLYSLIPKEYRIEYEELYTLPYYKDKWETDFGFFVNERIHAKLILKNTYLEVCRVLG